MLERRRADERESRPSAPLESNRFYGSRTSASEATGRRCSGTASRRILWASTSESMEFGPIADIKRASDDEDSVEKKPAFAKLSGEAEATSLGSAPYSLLDDAPGNADLLAGFGAPAAVDSTSSASGTTPDASARSDSFQQSASKSPSNPLKEEAADKASSKPASPPNIASPQDTEPGVAKPAVRPNVMESEASSTTNADRKCCPFFEGGWWNPKCLHPSVEELLYWRCPKKSGAAFGGGLVLLLSLTCFSLISVAAHTALGALMVSIAFRIYKNILQAVQKSSDGHPFKNLLEKDLSLPKQQVHDAAEIAIQHVDQAVARLRSLFLVEDLVDSLKLAVVLWLLTYVGSWFNGMTLIILAYVASFTLPKVYDTYKVEIDKYVSVARTQVCGVLGSIKSRIPGGQKPKEQ